MDSGKDVFVSEDNIMASKVRYEAIKAFKENRATAEQMKLLQDLDAAMQRARREGK